MPPAVHSLLTRRDSQIVAGLAALSALVAATAGTHPTGDTGIDMLLTAGLAGVATWMGASARWWALIAAAGLSLAGAVGGDAVTIVAAAAALALAGWIAVRRRSQPVARSFVAALCTNVALRLEWDPVFVSSAALAAVIIVLVTVPGFASRERSVRRRLILSTTLVVIMAGAALGALSIAGTQAAEPARDGYDAMLEGLELLQDGDVEGAEAQLRRAASDLETAGEHLDGPLTEAARALPVVAQHRNAAVSIVEGAAVTATAAADALASVDLDGLRVVNGAVDLEKLSSLAAPLRALEETVSSLDSTLADAQSPWLIEPLEERVVDARYEAGQAAHQAEALAVTAERAPDMLGASGSRRYLVAFVNSAESRGTNGLMGNWSEFTARDGALAVTANGRTAALQSRALRDLQLDVSDDYIDRYADYGALVDGGVAPKYWSNVTASPDLPSVGSAMSQMYEQATDRSVDGVFVVDAEGVAQLIDIVGAIKLPGTDITLTADNAEQFLTVGQYEFAEQEREAILAAVTTQTIANVLSGTLPEPQNLAATLSPAALNGHLSGWAATPSEQEVFTTVGMDGALPVVHVPATDALAVTSFNTGVNKIDSFLERTIDYAPVVDEQTGRVAATLRIDLHNTAPTSGLDPYVIGNRVGQPDGTNVTTVDVFTELTVDSASLDGEDFPVTFSRELGYEVVRKQIVIPSGETARLELTLSGNIGQGSYRLVYRPQPLPTPDHLVLDARTPSGDEIVSYSGQVERRTVFGAEGIEAWRIGEGPSEPT